MGLPERVILMSTAMLMIYQCALSDASGLTLACIAYWMQRNKARSDAATKTTRATNPAKKKERAT
ncbi:MAG: hypothetical protein NXH97_03265 [Rhodobacteraceae bacterium]|nr:hypothetical protein [Paracoccaceae bacterium]